MERYAFKIRHFKTTEGICYYDFYYDSYILELHLSNKDFCIFFTELANCCSVDVRPKLELEKIVIMKNTETWISENWLEYSPYPERYISSINNIVKVRGVVSYISGNKEKLYIEIDNNEQKYVFNIDREYLVHWVYNIAYSYKHGIEIEIEVNPEKDKLVGTQEIINVKQAAPVYKSA